MPQKIPHAEMLPKAATVTKAYTEEVHAYLLSLLTSPVGYKQANDRFLASYNASLLGDPEKVAACEADRKELDHQHSLLIGLAKLAAPQDPSLPEKLGLGPLPAKAGNGTSRLLKPENFRLTHGIIDGEMLGSVGYIKGARMFEIWGCEGDPNLEVNWKLLAASPNCTGIHVKGLTPGTKYWFRIRAIRGNETGPWSDYITLRAL